MTARAGIIAGGNWIVDHVKVVNEWPAQDTLATILEHSCSNGGAPYNVLVDLAHLGASFPLTGVGVVGNDANGGRVLADCTGHGIDVTQLHRRDAAETSFTDVVTVQPTGRRTFFHHRGANALLDVDDFSFAQTRAKIFHLGYLLLLDRLDRLHDGQPAAAAVLRSARRSGLITSLDCVSENGFRFITVVAPVLPLVDVLFANDFEAERLTGVRVRHEGAIIGSAVEAAARALCHKGVNQWVVLHFPEGAFACNPAGQEIWQPSVAVPPSEIVGTAGAGDALAAGVLYGVHENWPMEQSLRLGVCVAAASLRHASCSDGVTDLASCLELGKTWGYRSMAR